MIELSGDVVVVCEQIRRRILSEQNLHFAEKLVIACSGQWVGLSSLFLSLIFYFP